MPGQAGSTQCQGNHGSESEYSVVLNYGITRKNIKCGRSTRRGKQTKNHVLEMLIDRVSEVDKR